MANKGQKFKRHSPEFKEQILKEYQEGYGYRSLARIHPEISINTIKTWLRKTKHGIDIKVNHWEGHSGRKKTKNLTLEDYKERYEILKKYQAFLQARRGKK